MKKIVTLLIMSVVVLTACGSSNDLISMIEKSDASKEVIDCVKNAELITEGFYDYAPTGTATIKVGNKEFEVVYVNNTENKNEQMFEVNNKQYISNKICFK